MTDTEKKALALVNEAAKGVLYYELDDLDDPERVYFTKALCRAIEQHEAFKREVSDAVEGFNGRWGSKPMRKQDWENLTRFIIAKTDPLVEVINDADNMVRKPDAPSYAEAIRAALAARGLEIREKQP